jgi:hypothetical protein
MMKAKSVASSVRSHPTAGNTRQTNPSENDFDVRAVLPSVLWQESKVQIRKEYFLPPPDKNSVAAPKDDPASAWTNLKFVTGEEFDDFALRFHSFISLYPMYLDVFDTARIEELLTKFPTLAVRTYRKRNGDGPYTNTNLFKLLRDMKALLSELNAGPTPPAGKKAGAGASSVIPASRIGR